ncbi:MAG: hypothetical protein AAB456_00850 [Patescibacteria group bacterium]
MASDNLLAGLEGLFQGIAGTAVPIIQNSIKTRQQGALQAQNDERDFQNKINFLPYQLNQEKQLSAYQQGLKPSDTQIVVDEAGNQIGQPFVGQPGGGSVGITKVGKDTSGDYISGLDILLGRPDLKDTINPNKKYNKSMLPFLKPGAGTTKKLEGQGDAEFAISEIRRIRPLNERASGGFFGKIRQAGMAALDKEDQKFRDTEDVVNSLKSLVTKVLKSTFGGQLSNEERKYLDDVYGAAAGYSRAQRRIAMDNVERMLSSKIGSSPESAGSAGGGGLDPAKKARLEELRKKKQEGTLGTQ